MVNAPSIGLTDVKVLLDFCGLDVSGKADKPSNLSVTAQVITYSLVLFSVTLNSSKHGNMFFTARTPVLVAAGCSRICDL